MEEGRKDIANMDYLSYFSTEKSKNRRRTCKYCLLLRFFI